MIVPLSICLLAVQIAPATQAAARVQSEGLRLSVAIPAGRGGRVLQPGGTVPVVLVNLSDRPIRVWRDWCSWGYANLLLIFEDDAGKRWEAHREGRCWTENYPDFSELAPGESAIFSVDLGSNEWNGLPDVAALRGKSLHMSVVYQVDPEADSRRLQVWTGRLQSASQTYNVR